jgi:hypothetical protein
MLLCKVVQALAALLKHAKGGEAAAWRLHIGRLKQGDVLVLSTCSNSSSSSNTACATTNLQLARMNIGLSETTCLHASSCAVTFGCVWPVCYMLDGNKVPTLVKPIQHATKRWVDI